MTDETTNAPLQDTPEQEPVTPAAEPITPDSPPADSQEHMIPLSRFNEINNQLKALKAEQEKAAREAEAAQTKQLEEQNKFKELYEAEQKKAADAKAEAARIRQEQLQMQVATAAGYPGLWNRIKGGDEDELKADLKALLEAFPEQPKPAAPSLNGGAGTGSRKPGKPAPTEAEIIDMAGAYNISPHHLAEQYGVQLSTK